MAVKFGKYILLNKIATGGMAEVFRAKHIGVGGFEKIVAIKRILPHFSNNDEFITMFNEEAKVSAQLSHQNIVQIYEFGMVDNSYYIAMEYVDGINLNDLLIKFSDNDSVMPVSISLAIIRDACKGLDYAHRKKGFDNKPLNIIHRDISPKNIMVSFDGAVKVMDFGIAKAASRDYETRTGVIKGKISYLSPEQVQGARLDHRSDIFSLGIVFYELLTGTKCFKGESDFSILYKIKNSEFEPVSVINPEIKDELAPIVLKSLAQIKEDRYQTCDNLAKDIERYLTSQNLDPSETDISGFMHGLEDEFRDEMGELQEYFPEEGEMTKGIVFQLGANGQIPEEIETSITGENEKSRLQTEESLPDEGTQLVTSQPLRQTKAEKRSSILYFSGTLLLLILIVIVVLAATGNLPFGEKRAVHKIARIENPDFSSTDSQKPTFSFKFNINSEPSDATVIINGKESPEKTPMTVQGEGINGDTIEITVTKKCFTPETKEFELVKGMIPRKIDVTLERLVQDVMIKSIPADATIILDEKEVGKTPFILKQMDGCSSHSIKLVKTDYETLSESNIVFSNQSEEYTLKKKAIPGYLLVTSTYPVTIYSGSKKLGSSGDKLSLIEGNYSLTALSETHCIRHPFTVTINGRKTNQVNLTFGQLGHVRINSYPYSEVTVNGYNLGTTPISEKELPEGYYQVVWNFVTLGKKKTERLKMKRNIHQEWKGTINF